MPNIAANIPPISIGHRGCNHSKMLGMRLFRTPQAITFYAFFALSNCAAKNNWIHIRSLPQ
jgi:hypothetical protein